MRQAVEQFQRREDQFGAAALGWLAQAVDQVLVIEPAEALGVRDKYGIIAIRGNMQGLGHVVSGRRIMPEIISTRFQKLGMAGCGLIFLILTGSASAQILIANDDEFGIPYGETLVVEAFGVLENDTLDGENAGENGSTAELIEDANHGTLALNPDGSFSYSPGASFDGLDSFVYSAVFGPVSDQATVTLTACSGGPQVFTCWNESAFRAKAAEFGFGTIEEGFEDDSVWGIARSPYTAASVSSQGIRWETNHPGSPAFNEITTGNGPARTGMWGVFDSEHGYATGTPAECDIDDPPVHCLYHDGFSGTREPGLDPLHGVGGYITGIYGANVAIALDGAIPIGGGRIALGHQFFGVIDSGPAGFTHFEFRELDGKVGQALYVFGDDFTVLTPTPTAAHDGQNSDTRIFFAGASPNPSSGNTALRFTLTMEADVQLAIYDQRGRLIRKLTSEFRGVGAHAIHWDGRSRDGKTVSAGTYFGRLVVTRGAQRYVQVRKISVLH